MGALPGRPLGFVIDRLNTSASLYRIAPCLSGLVGSSVNVKLLSTTKSYYGL